MIQLITFVNYRAQKLKQKGDRMGRFDLRELHVFINKKIFIAVPEFSTFSILILICYYWSPDIGINKKGWSAS
jgi:hypothetical protein